MQETNVWIQIKQTSRGTIQNRNNTFDRIVRYLCVCLGHYEELGLMSWPSVEVLTVWLLKSLWRMLRLLLLLHQTNPHEVADVPTLITCLILSIVSYAVLCTLRWGLPLLLCWPLFLLYRRCNRWSRATHSTRSSKPPSLLKLLVIGQPCVVSSITKALS